MIKVTVKYLDESIPRILEFKHSNITSEQAIVDLINYPQILGIYPYDLCEDNFIEIDSTDIQTISNNIESSRLSIEDKHFLKLWITYVYNRGIEDLLIGIIDSMDLNDFKILGKGWDNTTDGYVKVECI